MNAPIFSLHGPECDECLFDALVLLRLPILFGDLILFKQTFLLDVSVLFFGFLVDGDLLYNIFVQLLDLLFLLGRVGPVLYFVQGVDQGHFSAVGLVHRPKKSLLGVIHLSKVNVNYLPWSLDCQLLHFGFVANVLFLESIPQMLFDMLPEVCL